LYIEAIIKHPMLTEGKIKNILLHELHFKTSASGGKGGQNVNKVETKVSVEFFVDESAFLSRIDKETIRKNYTTITKNGSIVLASDKYRTQWQNKKEVSGKLIQLLKKLLTPKKKRVATKPGKAALFKKEKNKKALKLKKEYRKKPEY